MTDGSELQQRYPNRATRIVTSTLGFFLGLSCMNHGLFEVLQGNVPANGLIVQAIGPAQRMWSHGTEEALTFVPNLLATGILAMVVGASIVVWSIGFVHRQNGPLVFILLFVTSVLVGGGIGQIPFFLVAWAGSTRIGAPLSWSRRVFSGSRGKVLAPLWPLLVPLGALLFLFALEIAIAGYVPGETNPERRLYVCWSLLGGTMVAYVLAFASALASDSRIAWRTP